jgi:hypothetical protein
VDFSFFNYPHLSYGAVPYHNSSHGADVAQTMHWFLKHGDIYGAMSPEERVASLIGALAHDLGHPGLTNNFLIATGDDTAMVYNDISVLENFHCAQLFRLLAKPGCNLLQYLPGDARKATRAIAIDLVLATDLKQHFEIISGFKARLVRGIDTASSDDRLLVLKMALKAADISNGAKGHAVQLRWTERVIDEFYGQGDREKQLRMPVSPFMDRARPAVAACEKGFFSFLVGPLFHAWAEYLPCVKETCIPLLEENFEDWKRKAELEKEKG